MRERGENIKSNKKPLQNNQETPDKKPKPSKSLWKYENKQYRRNELNYKPANPKI